jgi:hypothetical protein
MTPEKTEVKQRVIYSIIKAQDLCIISCFTVHSGDQCQSMGTQKAGFPANNDAHPSARY